MANPVMTIRIFKSYLSRENKTWVNSYEVGYGDIPDGSGFTALGEGTLSTSLATSAIDQIVAFEKAIHLPAVQFIRAVASTWVPDSDPYNPFNLMTMELGGWGEREATGDETDDIDLRNVVKIERRGATGKAGEVEYRGCLEKADVENSGGRWELAGTSPFLAELDVALGSFTTLLSPGEPEEPRMILVGGTLHKELVEKVTGGLTETVVKRTYIAPWHVRKVISMAYHGVGVRKQDNKSFDRP